VTLIVNVAPPSAVIVNEFDAGLLATVPSTGLLRPPLGRIAISVAVAVVPEMVRTPRTFRVEDDVRKRCPLTPRSCTWSSASHQR